MPEGRKLWLAKREEREKGKPTWNSNGDASVASPVASRHVRFPFYFLFHIYFYTITFTR